MSLSLFHSSHLPFSALTVTISLPESVLSPSLLLPLPSPGPLSHHLPRAARGLRGHHGARCSVGPLSRRASLRPAVPAAGRAEGGGWRGCTGQRGGVFSARRAEGLWGLQD